MICKNCKAEIPDTLTTCPKCGSNTGITKQLFCKKCGAPLVEGNDYCTSCGAYTENKKTEIEANNQSVAGMAGLGIVVPIVGFIMAASISKKNPNGSKVVLIASLIGFVIEASVFLPSIFYYI